MRYLFILIVAGSLASCANEELEALKAKNAELQVKVEGYKRMAEESAARAREAEAEAIAALKLTIEERRKAEQALKDCKGK